MLGCWILFVSLRSTDEQGEVDELKSDTLRVSKSGGSESERFSSASKGSQLVQRAGRPSELDSLPSDPSEGVALLRERYSGRWLGNQLEQAGYFYAKLGLEESKEFILNCPPGLAGNKGVEAAVSFIASEHRPGLFHFLQENTDVIGQATVEDGLDEFFKAWAGDDFEGGWSFLLGLELSREQKCKWAVKMLGGNREPILDVLSSVENPELRKDLTASWPSIKAHLAVRDYRVFSQLEGYLDERSARRSVQSQIDKSTYPVQAVEALYQSGVTGSREVVIDTLEELTARDVNSGIEVLTKLKDDELTSQVIAGSYKSIARYDLARAREWVGKIQDSKRRKAALEELEERERELKELK